MASSSPLVLESAVKRRLLLGSDMSWIIGYQSRRGAPVSTEDFDTASEALQIAIGMQRGGESIKYIRTPEGKDISMGELKAFVDGPAKSG
jgi:hypothetical protein